ncbi:MAG: M20 family metallopeptidase [Bacteroidota bacterium]
MNLKEKIQASARVYHSEVVSLRRHLHQHPELSFQEVETGRFIAEKLQEYNIPHEHGWAENGVVALIKGKHPQKKTIALRADIDALPITESNEVSYKSKHEGIMHACGHDVHASSLLGVAKILNEIKAHFEGQVKLIFQPAEEKAPGGANILIQEGVLQNPAPENIFGQHVHPPLAVGKVGFRAGKYMASTDELTLKVRGKGGHGALPHTCVDTILITAHILTALQQIVSRNADPTLPTVLTFGKINSKGGAHNVIPEEVTVLGTLRTMDEKWRQEAQQKIIKMASNLAAGMGGSCEVEILRGYPYLVNDDALTAKARQYAIEYLGEENVVDLPIRMTGEDFAYYSHEIPACFYRLGIKNDAKGIFGSLHTSSFNVDEDCLLHSTGLMAWLAVRELGNI